MTTRLPLSPEAQQARRPLPPDVLASAEEPAERVAGGAGRAVRTERIAPPWRTRGQPLREEGFREYTFRDPPAEPLTPETEAAFTARVERLRQWARQQLAADLETPR